MMQQLCTIEECEYCDFYKPELDDWECPIPNSWGCTYHDQYEDALGLCPDKPYCDNCFYCSSFNKEDNKCMNREIWGE